MLTKAQANRAVVEVDVLCELAATQVRSFMPTGLGQFWEKEDEELQLLLTDIPARFKRAIEKGQQRGWAAK